MQTRRRRPLAFPGFPCDQRITGDWKMVVFIWEECAQNNEESSCSRYKQHGNIRSHYIDDVLKSESETNVVTFSIRKDGTYEVMREASDVNAWPFTTTGNWVWESNVKNKSAFSLDRYFNIVRLSNKELILEYEQIHEFENNDILVEMKRYEYRVFEKVK